MSKILTLEDVPPRLLDLGQTCSAMDELINTILNEGADENTGRIQLLHAGLHAVWGDMLKMMDEITACEEVKQ